MGWPQVHEHSAEKPVSIGEEEAKARLGRSRSRFRFGMLSIFIIIDWPQDHGHSFAAAAQRELGVRTKSAWRGPTVLSVDQDICFSGKAIDLA